MVLPWLAGMDSGLSKRIAIYRLYRDAIVSGQLKARQRLASSRVLAAEYGVARMTCEEALDQLAAEGFVERQQGKGSFVSAIEWHPVLEGDSKVNPLKSQGAVAAWSHWARQLLEMPPCVEPKVLKPFNAALPPLDLIPQNLWRKLVEKTLKSSTAKDLAYGDPGGYWALRVAVAKHLA